MKNISFKLNNFAARNFETVKKKAVFAGGCFWGMEELFRQLPGIVDTETGYTGGQNENPTYQNHPGHAEALEITYDSNQITYRKLLDFFFRIHNPTTLNRQGNDIGSSYRSAVFYSSVEERAEAQQFIELVNASKRWPDPVVTTLESLGVFYPAESVHQDYLQRTPDGYTCHAIRFNSYLEE